MDNPNQNIYYYTGGGNSSSGSSGRRQRQEANDNGGDNEEEARYGHQAQQLLFPSFQLNPPYYQQPQDPQDDTFLRDASLTQHPDFLEPQTMPSYADTSVIQPTPFLRTQSPYSMPNEHFATGSQAMFGSGLYGQSHFQLQPRSSQMQRQDGRQDEELYQQQISEDPMAISSSVIKYTTAGDSMDSSGFKGRTLLPGLHHPHSPHLLPLASAPPRRQQQQQQPEIAVAASGPGMQVESQMSESASASSSNNNWDYGAYIGSFGKRPHDNMALYQRAQIRRKADASASSNSKESRQPVRTKWTPTYFPRHVLSVYFTDNEDIPNDFYTEKDILTAIKESIRFVAGGNTESEPPVTLAMTSLSPRAGISAIEKISPFSLLKAGMAQEPQNYTKIMHHALKYNLEKSLQEVIRQTREKLDSHIAPLPTPRTKYKIHGFSDKALETNIFDYLLRYIVVEHAMFRAIENPGSVGKSASTTASSPSLTGTWLTGFRLMAAFISKLARELAKTNDIFLDNGDVDEVSDYEIKFATGVFAFLLFLIRKYFRTDILFSTGAYSMPAPGQINAWLRLFFDDSDGKGCYRIMFNSDDINQGLSSGFLDAIVPFIPDTL
ncbi:hypothetical protein H4219_004661 [Mycoemilia scoparia]|uniref:Uncharacterized protein n=1 Tax=Mycoemilia scoparia TaxID=417184 RepID=A0A9W7ZVJ6_9FUNG|nr:hypothetical protein H4219_004661 [Mycoemilia scoparia]